MSLTDAHAYFGDAAPLIFFYWNGVRFVSYHHVPLSWHHAGGACYEYDGGDGDGGDGDGGGFLPRRSLKLEWIKR